MTVATMTELRGRHVLVILLCFFGAMLAVNGVFIYLAVSTFNGMESDAYQKGLHYNERIEAGRAQAALGWSHHLTIGPDERVLVSVTDRSGAPVTGLAVTGEIGRPVADRFTQALTFREIAAGRYAAPTASLQAGNWVVALEARPVRGGGSGMVYQIKERLWLKPPQ